MLKLINEKLLNDLFWKQNFLSITQRSILDHGSFDLDNAII